MSQSKRHPNKPLAQELGERGEARGGPGPATWHEVSEVASYWSDLSGHIYPHAVLQLLQDSAWKHADALGFGYSHLEQDSLLWVLSRLDLHITRMPEWGETVRLETWTTGTHKLFALREFCLYDDEERELLRANSGWLVLDGNTRKPRRPQPVVETRDITITPGNYDETPRKLTTSLPETDRDNVLTLRVRYSDIDAQEHVNNARYLEWMLNDLPDEWLSLYRPREISINFLRECRIGESLAVTHVRGEENTRMHSQHCVLRENDAVCLLEVTWECRENP